MLDVIKNYLSSKDSQKLDEYLQYLDLKTLKTRKKMEKLENAHLDEVSFLKRFFKLNERHLINIWSHDALRGNMDYIHRHIYYCFNGMYLSMQSRDHFRESQKHVLKLMEESEKKYDRCVYEYYKYANHGHFMEIFDDQAFERIFDRPDTNNLMFVAKPDEPVYAWKAISALYLLMTHNRLDRAKYFLDCLQGYRHMPRRGSPWRPDQYADMVDFYQLIYNARLTDDPEVKKQHVARAFICNLKAVVNAFGHPQFGSDFRCLEPSLGLNTLIEFGLDDDWAKQCCQAMLPWLDYARWHPAFLKAMEWNAWVPPISEFTTMPTEEMTELRRMIYIEISKP